MTSLQETRRMGAQGLVARIRERDMPAFGRSVEAIRDLAGDELASASALAAIILQDAALTTKVLKLANSAYCNPGGQHINTVSRALVVLGFDAVANMALSLVLIDAMLRGGVRARVVNEMARAFHAAVQARTLSALRGEANPEEVFISALLARVGEMAFWCFGDEAAQSLDTALSSGVPADTAETNVLGFRLRQITVGLVREWRLSGLLVSVLERGEAGGAQEKNVTLAHALALATERGWETPSARKILEQIAVHAGRPLAELMDTLAQNAAAAAQAARVYGVAEAVGMIPLPQSHAGAVLPEPEEPPGPDPMLQLKILRDLSMLIAGKPNLNDVLNLALEGIFRGIGMDRALFALMTPDRKNLVGKAGLGSGADALCKSFQFPLDGSPGELINTVLSRQQNVVIDSVFEAPYRMDRLARAGGMPPCVVAPIVVQGKSIGLFYADHVKGGAISADDAQAFQHFVQQAALGFEHVAARGSRP